MVSYICYFCSNENYSFSFSIQSVIFGTVKSLFLIPYAHQSTATASAMYPIVSMGHTIQTTMLYYLVFWGMAKLSHKRHGLLSLIMIVAIVVCGYLFKPTSVFLKFYLKADLIFFIAGIIAYYILS